MYDILSLKTQNKDTRKTAPCLLILHAIGLSLEESLEGLCYPLGVKGGLGVSSHYLIPQQSGNNLLRDFPQFFDPTKLKFPDNVPVIQFLPEEEKAFHAGRSHWGAYNQLPGCEVGLNDCSIGIEFHTPGYGDHGKDWFHFTPYTTQQIQTGIALIQNIQKNWSIPGHNVLAHSDIAPYFPATAETPARFKTDPGPLFPWHLVKKHNIGILPDLIKGDTLWEKLKDIGYAIQSSEPKIQDIEKQYILNAFQMHYMNDTYQFQHPESLVLKEYEQQLEKKLKDRTFF